MEEPFDPHIHSSQPPGRGPALAVEAAIAAKAICFSIVMVPLVDPSAVSASARSRPRAGSRRRPLAFRSRWSTHSATRLARWSRSCRNPTRRSRRASQSIAVRPRDVGETGQLDAVERGAVHSAPPFFAVAGTRAGAGGRSGDGGEGGESELLQHGRGPLCWIEVLSVSASPRSRLWAISQRSRRTFPSRRSAAPPAQQHALVGRAVQPAPPFVAAAAGTAGVAGRSDTKGGGRGEWVRASGFNMVVGSPARYEFRAVLRSTARRASRGIVSGRLPG